MQDFLLTDKETKLIVELLREKQRAIQLQDVAAPDTQICRDQSITAHVVQRLIERFEELGEPING